MTARQPAFMTPRGVIRCAFCRDDEYGLPLTERQGEHHFSVRFRDNETFNRGGYLAQVTLDGEDVTRRTFEAIAGDDGVVYLYDHNGRGTPYVCPTAPPDAPHAVIVKHVGRVSVGRRRAS